MIETKFLTDNIELYKEALKKRGSKLDLDSLVAVIEERKTTLIELEKLRHERNALSALKEKPDELIIEKGKALKESIQALEKKLTQIEPALNAQIISIPNLVSEQAPLGPEENKKTIKTWGEQPTFDFTPLDHEQIGTTLDLIDFERGAKVAGSKFYYLKNEAVFLEFALVQFALETLIQEGFIPVITPQLINNEILEGMGFQPRGPETQMYGITDTNLSLIGTAEHTLGGMHAGETLASLPIKYAGFSSCFRTEAGGYGKFSKGLYRVHQFDKIEMFVYTTPEDSEAMHQMLLELEEKIWQKLGIPYRIVDLPTEDLGASSYRTYDIEAWMPGRDGGEYSEVTSTSNTTDYQARRLTIKYQAANHTDYVHMLNGTAIAISRALIVILENYQQKDGSVLIPEVLQKYTHFTSIKPKTNT